MFGKKRDRDQEPSFQRNAEYSGASADSEREIETENEPDTKVQTARLSSDAQIEGTIKFDGNMRIDGNVNGKISTENGELVVSESGFVNATITTKNAVINGRIDGKIIASDKIVLKQKAHLNGDLQAKILVIEEGVVFIGQCNVNPEGVKFDQITKRDKPKMHHKQQENFSTNKGNTAKSAR